MRWSACLFFAAFVECVVGEQKNADGSALVAAAAAGKLSSILAELDAGANIEYIGKDGTAMVVAAAAGHVTAVELLISKVLNSPRLRFFNAFHG